MMGIKLGSATHNIPVGEPVPLSHSRVSRVGSSELGCQGFGHQGTFSLFFFLFILT